MTREETIEGNKIIAEFMGWKKSKKSDHYYYPENSRRYYSGKQILYHNSWDWLMPVVEKIQSIDITPAPNYTGYRIEIVVQGYVKIKGSPMPPIFTNVSIEGSLINAVWKAVVQFIQWYNENINSNPIHQ